MQPNKLKRFKGVAVGMFLGDASTYRKNNRSEALLQIQHADKQYEYARYKCDLLNNFIMAHLYTYDRSYSWGIKTIHHIRTRRHPIFTDLHEKYRNLDGKTKTLDLHLLNWLTVEGLALWYMDDGWLNRRVNTKTKNLHELTSPIYYWNGVGLATHGFSYRENELIRDYLKESWGIDSTIRRKRSLFYQFIGRVGSFKLFSLVDKFIIPSMRYKLDWQCGAAESNEDRLYRLKRCSELHSDVEILAEMTRTPDNFGE